MRKPSRLTYVTVVVVIAAGGALLSYQAARMTADSEPPPPSVGTPNPPQVPELSAADLERAVDLLMSSSELEQFGDQGEMDVRMPASWYQHGDFLGVQFELWLPGPLAGTFDFVVSQYREDPLDARPYDRFRLPLTVEDLASLLVAIDLRNGIVAELSPGDGAEITAQGNPTPD